MLSIVCEGLALCLFLCLNGVQSEPKAANCRGGKSYCFLFVIVCCWSVCSEKFPSSPKGRWFKSTPPATNICNNLGELTFGFPLILCVFSVPHAEQMAKRTCPIETLRARSIARARNLRSRALSRKSDKGSGLVGIDCLARHRPHAACERARWSTPFPANLCNSVSGMENSARPQFMQTETCGKTQTVGLVRPSWPGK